MLGLHRQSEGETEIEELSHYTHRRQGARELTEEGKELGNWGHHYYKSLNIAKKKVILQGLIFKAEDCTLAVFLRYGKGPVPNLTSCWKIFPNWVEVSKLWILHTGMG